MPRTRRGPATDMKTSTVAAINAELATARRHFPTNNNVLRTLKDRLKMLEIMMREHTTSPLKRASANAQQLWAEAIVVAAMAIRLVEDGSGEFSYGDYQQQQSDALDAIIGARCPSGKPCAKTPPCTNVISCDENTQTHLFDGDQQ